MRTQRFSILLIILLGAASIGVAGAARPGLLAAQSGNPLCGAAPNILSWSTATEVNTAGFNLYRAESAEGPFVRINPQVIPASRNTVTGSSYSYEDKDVTPGTTYYYQLEDVELSGSTTRHGPIQIRAQSLLWLCDNPGAGVILAVLALAALLAGAWLQRQRSRARARVNA